jgi:4-hydroxybenzoate polyprenyltransferase
MQRLKLLLDMIKFEHTIFALPFALLALFLASDGLPATRTLLWIVVAMVGARTTAMTMNRIADRDVDAANPRTRMRHLPAGSVRLRDAWILCIAGAILLIVAAWQLNRLALLLSPLALAIVWSYTWTKRFTAASHLWLGVALALAPLGAWIAARGRLEMPAVWLAIGVLFWVAGFDTIYACQDVEFDRGHKLHSLPARLGPRNALRLARAFHVLMLAAFTALGIVLHAGFLYWIGLAAILGLVIVQHSLVRAADLRHIDVAFFNVNSIVGALLLVFALADRFWVR